MSWMAAAVIVAALAGQAFWIAHALDEVGKRLDRRGERLDRIEAGGYVERRADGGGEA